MRAHHELNDWEPEELPPLWSIVMVTVLALALFFGGVIAWAHNQPEKWDPSENWTTFEDIPE